MEPRNMAIGGVFADSKRLVVPIYQRTFEWTPERQIETLMDYIEAKAEARLANEPARFLHYMGALLLIPRSGFVFGRIPVFDIVDGQQRITTFQLAPAALRDLANERGEQSIADQIRPLLFNLDEASMQDKKAERFKLEPTRLDRPIFRDLMTKSLAELQEAYATYFTQAGNIRKTAVPPPKPLAAWCYIPQRAAEFLKEASGPGMRLRALLEAMLQDLHLIVITIAESDDAQVIFETLNFGGEPLAAMDLVRNDVFRRAARNNQNIEDLMDTGWSMFETQFWKEKATQGRITKPRMDFFLAHALAAETGKETLLNELYAAYKRYSSERNYPTVEAELQTLRKHAPTYQALVSSEAGPMARLAYALDVFDMRTAYPLVLALNAATSDEQAREAVYRLSNPTLYAALSAASRRRITTPYSFASRQLPVRAEDRSKRCVSPSRNTADRPIYSGAIKTCGKPLRRDQRIRIFRARAYGISYASWNLPHATNTVRSRACDGYVRVDVAARMRDMWR